jgi:hypothetical protein
MSMQMGVAVRPSGDGPVAYDRLTGGPVDRGKGRES